MGRFVLVAWAVIAAAFSMPAVARDASGERSFAGTWQARFHGDVICTLTIETGERLSGALHGCSINVNQNGDLLESRRAARADERSPIQNLTIQERTPSFEVNDIGDTMKFELVLTAEDQAELRFIEVPIKIKPIRFERQAG